MAIYGPPLTDAQRSELIRSQSDFLRAFQDDPETCAVVASQGGAAQDGAAMPRAASEDDYVALVADMIETGTSEHELQMLFSENSADPTYCAATLDFMDAVADLPGAAGIVVRFEITQGLLTAQ